MDLFMLNLKSQTAIFGGYFSGYIWWFAIVLSVLMYLVLLYLKHRRYFGLLSVIPGPKSHKIFGNVDSVTPFLKTDFPHALLFQTLSGFAKVFEDERMFRFWICFRPIVALYKPETVEAILSNTSTIDKAFEYNFLRPWLDTGLLTSTGEKWKMRRKLLTPAFHFRILDDFVPVFNKQSKTFVNTLRNYLDHNYVDIVTPVTRCTLDIICETILGVNMQAQSNAESEYVTSVHKVGEIALARAMKPWLWPDFIFYRCPSGKIFRQNLNVLHNFSRKIIQARKREHLQGGRTITKRKQQAFLDLLLTHHLRDESFSEEDIREEVDTFVFEGHDTTAMGLSWSLYLIGLHPEIQQKLHQELDFIFGDDLERDVTMEDLKEMKYLECVLKESQRLYPSVPFMGRELNEDIEINGYIVPKETTCFVFTFMLHRNKEAFPDPEVFNPDRFQSDECLGRHPFAYVPFSAGPRNCIGQKFAMMEMKIVVSTVLRHFDLQSLDKRDEVLLIPEMVLRPKNGLRLKISKRKL